MVRPEARAADSRQVPLPPTSRSELLSRSVGLVTQLGTAAALTATGALVGGMAQAAHEQDAAREAAKQQAATAAPATRVVVKPVPRRVRTVVVRVPGQLPASAQAAPAAPRSRVVRRTTRQPSAGNQGPSRSAPAPTSAAPATTSSGS